MDSTSSISENLKELERAHLLVKSTASELKRWFESVIEPNLQIGTVVDISSLGQAYNAQVLRGRGYGKHFRIESKVSVNVEVSHPSLSHWSLYAISVDPTDHNCTLGKQVWLKGRVFPSFLMDPDEQEHSRVMEAVTKLLEENEMKGTNHV